VLGLQVLQEARRWVPGRKWKFHVVNHSDAEVFRKLVKGEGDELAVRVSTREAVNGIP